MSNKKQAVTIKIVSPRLPKTLAESTPNTLVFEDEALIQGLSTTGADLSSTKAEKMYVRESVFKHVDFREAYLHRLDLVDARFENCDFSNCNFSDGVMHRVAFINCKLVGVNWSGVNFVDVTFESCSGTYGNFSHARFRQCAFSTCHFQHADLQDCEFKMVLLDAVDLRQCAFAGTRLFGIDLSTCQIEGLSIRPDELRGCTVSPEQTVLLAGLFGLVVKLD